MSDHPSVEKWDQFLDGQLSPGECQTLEAHLDTCAECQRVLDQQSLPGDAFLFLAETASHAEAQQNAPKMVPLPGQPPRVPGPMAGRPRYRSARCLAQGGQGEVWLAVDTELHREVALKRLRKRWRGNQDILHRFRREVEVTARLQHPGVVPVHDLIYDDDGQPCYVMRFIEGESLGDAIARFHEADRQLKRDPGERNLALRNLLSRFVAACKTVAYAHSRGVLHRDLKPANIMLGHYGETLVVDWGLAKTLQGTEQARDDREEPQAPGWTEGISQTLVGDVLGTPPYMSPEQAAGRWHEVGPPSDIYSLGASLYFLLTGQPPFSEQGMSDRPQSGTLAWSQQSKADVPRALKAICCKAMAQRPEDRYASAVDLASDLEHWLADEPVLAYREPLGPRARRWTRRHKPLVTAATVAVFLLGAVAVSVWTWRERDRAARQTEATQQALETRLAVEALLSEVQDHQRRGEWAEARAALSRAMGRLGDADSEELRQQVARMWSDVQMIARLDKIRQHENIDNESHDYDWDAAPPAYAIAFREYGLDMDAEVSQVAKRIRASPLQEHLLAALDDWAECSSDARQRARLGAIARQADPHPWRDRFRDPALRANPTALIKLAKEAPLEELSPAILTSLANHLRRYNPGEAVRLLRRAQHHHPGDFFLHCMLAYALYCHSQHATGQEVGLLREEAIGSLHAALAIRPRSAKALSDLGVNLLEQGRAEEAEVAHRKAVRLQPDSALPHANLSAALRVLGKLDGAVVEAQEAIRLKPKRANSYSLLGYALLLQGKPRAAEAAYRKAIEIDPNHIRARIRLGAALRDQGCLEEAEKVGRAATQKEPRDSFAHHQLGVTLFMREKYEDAESSYRNAIRLLPDAADSHLQLACVLKLQGRFVAALRSAQHGLNLLPRGNRRPSWWVKEAEWLVALASKSVGRFSGKGQVANAEELIFVAHINAHLRGQYVGTARLLHSAFTECSEYAESASAYPAARPRYFAAWCASMAGWGQRDVASLKDEDRIRWRQQALEWFRQELAYWDKQVASGNPDAMTQANRALMSWKNDGTLWEFRRAKALAPLSGKERQEWQTLWANLERLLQQTRAVPAAKG